MCVTSVKALPTADTYCISRLPVRSPFPASDVELASKRTAAETGHFFFKSILFCIVTMTAFQLACLLQVMKTKLPHQDSGISGVHL